MAVGWNVLKLSMRSISSNVSFKMCFLINFLFWWFVHWCEWDVKKSPPIIVLLSISPSMSVSVCLMYWGALVDCIDSYNCYVFLSDWSLDHYVVSFLISCNLLYFKVYFVWYGDCSSGFLRLPICTEYIFPSSHFKPIVSLGPK